jgi:hypothetical protein
LLELGDCAVRVDRRFIVSDDLTVVINFGCELTLMDVPLLKVHQ